MHCTGRSSRTEPTMPSASRPLLAAAAAAVLLLLLLGSSDAFLFSRCRLPVRPALTTKGAAAVGLGASKPSLGLFGCVFLGRPVGGYAGCRHGGCPVSGGVFITEGTQPQPKCMQHAAASVRSTHPIDTKRDANPDTPHHFTSIHARQQAAGLPRRRGPAAAPRLAAGGAQGRHRGLCWRRRPERRPCGHAQERRWVGLTVLCACACVFVCCKSTSPDARVLTS